MNSDFDKNLTYFENNLNSDDIPTVFIHGVGLNSSMWFPQKSYFKNKNVIITGITSGIVLFPTIQKLKRKTSFCKSPQMDFCTTPK